MQGQPGQSGRYSPNAKANHGALSRCAGPSRILIPIWKLQPGRHRTILVNCVGAMDGQTLT